MGLRWNDDDNDVYDNKHGASMEQVQMARLPSLESKLTFLSNELFFSFIFCFLSAKCLRKYMVNKIMIEIYFQSLTQGYSEKTRVLLTRVDTMTFCLTVSERILV